MISCNEGRCTVQGPITVDNVVALLALGNGLFGAPQVTVDLAAVRQQIASNPASILLMI